MHMRKTIIAGNWKMNLTPAQGIVLVSQVWDAIKDTDLTDRKVVFAPPMVSIVPVADKMKNMPNISVAAQNVSSHTSGAYTGETSAQMLAASGAQWAIIGHSERRAYYNETNVELALKVSCSLVENITPIYCCGESLIERNKGTYKACVERQITAGIFHLSPDQISKIAIAYEPVWAIGTGETATPAQAQAMHGFIRDLIASKYGTQIANGISILYGGSMKPGNAKDLLTMADIDGGLIGGASLKAADFIAIIKETL